jgi:hypothetical protein
MIEDAAGDTERSAGADKSPRSVSDEMLMHTLRGDTSEHEPDSFSAAIDEGPC